MKELLKVNLIDKYQQHSLKHTKISKGCENEMHNTFIYIQV